VLSRATYSQCSGNPSGVTVGPSGEKISEMIYVTRCAKTGDPSICVATKKTTQENSQDNSQWSSHLIRSHKFVDMNTFRYTKLNISQSMCSSVHSPGVGTCVFSKKRHMHIHAYEPRSVACTSMEIIYNVQKCIQAYNHVHTALQARE